MAGARRRRCAGMGSWGSRVQGRVVSGAARRCRRLGGNGVDGEALQLRGGEASARNSGELRRDGSRLHKNNNGERLEMRRDMGNGMESSKGGRLTESTGSVEIRRRNGRLRRANWAALGRIGCVRRGEIEEGGEGYL